MRIALNGATTMHADLETDIKAAAAAGFYGIEIWASKLRAFLRDHTTTDLKALFQTYKLAPCSINSIERITFRDEGGRANLLTECNELCRVASEVGCPYIVVVPSPLPSHTERNEVIDESRRVLTDLSNIAEDFGVALA